MPVPEDATSDEADRGPLLVRFSAERGAEMAHARLRMVSAAVSALASICVLLGKVPVVVFLVALLGLILSLAWFAQARKSARRARDPGATYLALHARGLLWSQPPRAPIWVAWDEVSELEVDEERLDVRVSRKAAPPLHIEPCYPGVEIHELVHRLRNAWLSSSDPAKP
jgi:hypothetical protein